MHITTASPELECLCPQRQELWAPLVASLLITEEAYQVQAQVPLN